MDKLVVSVETKTVIQTMIGSLGQRVKRRTVFIMAPWSVPWIYLTQNLILELLLATYNNFRTSG